MNSQIVRFEGLTVVQLKMKVCLSVRLSHWGYSSITPHSLSSWSWFMFFSQPTRQMLYSTAQQGIAGDYHNLSSLLHTTYSVV
jgi:hypothetical protein